MMIVLTPINCNNNKTIKKWMTWNKQEHSYLVIYKDWPMEIFESGIEYSEYNI